MGDSRPSEVRVSPIFRGGASAAAVLTVACLLLTACGATDAPGSEQIGHVDGSKIGVVATTPILADLAARIGGDRSEVTSLVPSGADPHTYEPRLRNIRDIAHADLALTSGLLLEPQKLLRTLTSNLPSRAGRPLAVAEKIESHGGTLRPMTEDISLDTVWLGFRAEGLGPDPDAPVTFRTGEMTGPGRAVAFVTQTFGRVSIVADSDGLSSQSESGSASAGSMDLPQQTHTHLSWGFTEAGDYTVEVGASSGDLTVPSQKVHFAVGNDAHESARRLGPDAEVVDQGHVDITVDLARRRTVLRMDTPSGVRELDPARTVLVVPPKALQELPAGREYRFLGRPGQQIYLLAQAVLGEHIHGDIDPHFWHSVPNVKAAVQAIQESMTARDPAGARTYDENSRAFLRELDRLDADLTEQYSSLPEAERGLVTTHDGYGYLAERYGLRVEGFVAPVPGTEPSLQQRRRIGRAIQDLRIPAVFVDKGSRGRGNVLGQIADEYDVRVCELYSDTLDREAPHYTDLMRINAKTITTCLRR